MIRLAAAAAIGFLVACTPANMPVVSVPAVNVSMDCGLIPYSDFVSWEKKFISANPTEMTRGEYKGSNLEILLYHYNNTPPTSITITADRAYSYIKKTGRSVYILFVKGGCVEANLQVVYPLFMQWLGDMEDVNGKPLPVPPRTIEA